MQVFANFSRASRPQLGGGDENANLAHLQVERPQGVVVDVRDDAIQHAQPTGNAFAGDLVDHCLHMLGSHLMPFMTFSPSYSLYMQLSVCQEEGNKKMES